MKKVKILATVASLMLVLALLCFGIYSASQATFTLKSTVSFKVTDVYIKVNYGIEETKQDFGPYYSDESRGTPLLAEKADLPNAKFTEEANVCTYYVTVENLHGMPIFISFNYSWTSTSKFDGVAVAVEASLTNVTEDYDAPEFAPTEDSQKDGENTVSTSKYGTGYQEFAAKETLTFKVKLTLSEDAMDYVLSGALNLEVNATVDDPSKA